MNKKFYNSIPYIIGTLTLVFSHLSTSVNSQSLGYGEECEFNEQCPSISLLPSSTPLPENFGPRAVQPGICDEASNGRCCDPRYNQNVKRCIPTKTVGDPCTADIQCRRIPGICQDGVCKCNPDTSLPSILEGRNSCKCKDGFVKGTTPEDCIKLVGIHGDACNPQEHEWPYGGACSLYEVLCMNEMDPSRRDGFCRGGCRSKDSFGKEWEAALGTFAVNRCPFGRFGFLFYDAKWFCGEDGVFNSTVPDYSGCDTDWVKAILRDINKVKEIRFEDAINLADQIIGNVSTAMASPMPGGGSDFFGHEISKLLEVLGQLADKFIPLADPDENFKLAGSIFKTVDMILKYETPWLGLNEPNADTFSKVLDTMSNVPLKVAQKGCYRDGVSMCKFPIGFETGKMGHAASKDVSQSIKMASRSEQIRGQKSSFNIILYQDEDQFWVASSISSEYTRKYSNQKLMISSGYDLEFKTNSDLLSFSALNLESNGTKRTKRDAVPATLTVPIDLTFWHTDYSWSSEVKKIQRSLHPGENPTAVKDSVQCVFWDAFNGAWSSEGCRVTGSSAFSTTCVCDHLSSFTLVMKVHKYIGHSIPLRAITIFIVTLLMFYLALKIFLLKSNSDSEEDVEQQRSKVVKNMSLILTLFCYGLIFFVVDKSYFFFHNVTCYRIGMLGHLMSLITVLVLTSEFLLATIDYTCLKEAEFLTIAARNKPHIMFLGIPFGISFLVVAATVAIDHYDGLNTRAYGGEFCWLDEPFVNALFIPLWILLGFNFFLFFLIVRKTCGYIRVGLGTLPTLGGRDAKVAEVTFYLKNGVLTNSLVLSTWLIAFFHLGPHFKDYKILSWIFPIIFTLQGILMERVMDKDAFIERIKKKLLGWLIPLFISVPAAGPGGRGGYDVQKAEQSANKNFSSETTKMLSPKKENLELKRENRTQEVRPLQNNLDPKLETLQIDEQKQAKKDGRRTLDVNPRKQNQAKTHDEEQESTQRMADNGGEIVDELSRTIKEPNFILLREISTSISNRNGQN